MYNKLKHQQHKVKHNNEKWDTSISQAIQKVFVGPDFWLLYNYVIQASQKLGCYIMSHFYFLYALVFSSSMHHRWFYFSKYMLYLEHLVVCCHPETPTR